MCVGLWVDWEGWEVGVDLWLVGVVLWWLCDLWFVDVCVDLVVVVDIDWFVGGGSVDCVVEF